MNAVLSILAVIFIFLLCNYLYRKIKGIPDKPLKEIWNEIKFEWSKYKQESKEDWIKYKQKIQKINEKFKEENKQKKDLEEIEIIANYYEISLIEAAKIHYGKAIITEEIIERLERPYRKLYEQYKKLSINEQRKFLHDLILNNQDEYAEAIRFIQIAEESVNIALKSKNKDIAESRRKLALEIEQKIQEGYPKAYGLIIDTIQLLEDNYDVNLFENQCIKYYEEAQKLKTIKSKQKRIDYINDLIKEAEINPKIDEKFVNFWKNKVKEIL
ncbi:hypothetical protein EX128_02365 [Campylobacter jejuni]|uniref:hypothetical protein n=1 Tax=unclassified Campylobacter TaxID=2593542 RepID=UPI0011D09C21|nr:MULTISPECIES: hypothetical protein [unclassified Campylobacter]EAH9333953.1 hypothetical protein [Campylobacter jejuni]EAH9335641.1 hypothetical protein [Campylobacter jejuni]EAH9921558.1 hypothetical protein [Campylobacter jejuni]EAI2796462.1 hypothetical protein [Campylobacter jejuni]EAJ5020585.1 hypothetical protein [Campylobacter jejuni]